MILHLYVPRAGVDLPRGAALVGLPDASGRIVAAIDTDGKHFLNRVTRAAIRYRRAPGAKTSLRRFEPEQVRPVATYDAERWAMADVLDKDSLEVWANEYLTTMLRRAQFTPAPAATPKRQSVGQS
jgi:hypothetical protein